MVTIDDIKLEYQEEFAEAQLEQMYNFVIDCPTDVRCDTDGLRRKNEKLVQKLLHIANHNADWERFFQRKPKQHKRNNSDCVILILFLMFAATLLCIMFG